MKAARAAGNDESDAIGRHHLTPEVKQLEKVSVQRLISALTSTLYSRRVAIEHDVDTAQGPLDVQRLSARLVLLVRPTLCDCLKKTVDLLSGTNSRLLPQYY